MSDALTPFQLTGKTILITGGGGFLGEYFAGAVAAAGGNVVIADINVEAAQRVTDSLAKNYSVPTQALAMDVTKKESISEAFAQAVTTFKRIDVVVNNAAIDPKFDAGADANKKLFENYPEELLRQSLDVNLLGYALVAQAAVAHMLTTGGGHIINISSIYGMVGPDQRIYPAGTQKPIDYAMTKGGVVVLTRWLAATYGDKGIRSNTYTLGGVFKGHDQTFLEKYGARTPLGRMAKPEEVGAPLVFLASDASSYMTGSELVADGGWTAW